MNEHSYTQSITSKLSKDRYKWKINDSYQGGVPDLFFEGLVRDLWIEVKYVKPFPKRDNTLINLVGNRYLSKLQQLWLIRRENLRHDTCILIGCEHGGVLLEGLSWQAPITAGWIKERCQTARIITRQIEKIASMQ